MDIVPSRETLGARVEGVDIARPLGDRDFDALWRALGHHGVLCFPGQDLDAPALKAFAARFGSLEVNVAAGSYHAPGHPEVMILSNVVEGGRALGLADAGQGWHTDMSYSETIAFANVLYGVRIPHRDGRALGATEFADMHAAYEGLPDEIKQRLDGARAVHDFEKFWEVMRARPGSTRPPLTEEQRLRKPPVSHPIFLTHPITGRKVLYANPGYAIGIEGFPAGESDRLLEMLFEHQLREEYLYRHEWTERDLLIWDDIGTLHRAIADYGPDEPRLILRCQVMADRVFADAA